MAEDKKDLIPKETAFPAEEQPKIENVPDTVQETDDGAEKSETHSQQQVEDLSDWLNTTQSDEAQSKNQDYNKVKDEKKDEKEEKKDASSDPNIIPVDAEKQSGEKKTGKFSGRMPILIAGIVIGALIAIYGIGCIFYNSHFFNRSQINGFDVANCSAEKTVQNLKDQEGNYELTLKKLDESTLTLKGKDFDFRYNDNGTVQKVLDSQVCWQWPVGLFSDTKYDADLNYQYDDTKLQTAIDAMNVNAEGEAQPAVNAHPAWQNGQVEIVKEVYGNTVNKDQLNTVVRAAVQKGEKELDLKQAGAYETPKYLSDAPEVSAAKTAMEKAAKSVLTYTIDDDREILNVNTFGSWLICDEVMTVGVDQEKGAAYLATLGDKYDTAGGDFNFTTSGGSSIVVSGGTFGWVVDEAAELPLMTADILSGETVTRPISSKGAETRTGAKSIGSTYVEISLSAQTMWLYVDGSCLVETPVVTGGPGHRTPTGVYRIEAHSRNAVLKGTNDDGSKYESYVQYWMPFYDGDGIHDASWRSSFGGSIYVSNGSHGCVNTPLNAVSTIFNNTSNGCPVVLY